jgi:hypothetical protein
MKRLGIPIAALAAFSIANAQVILTPGDTSALDQVGGSGWGTGSVAYDGGAVSVLTGAVVIPSETDGWLVREGPGASNHLLYPLNNEGLAWAANFGVPGDLQLNTWYFIATGSGGSQGGDIHSMHNEVFRSESFMLIPEPGTYALIAGLGLVGFAGWRRLSK